MANLKFYKMAQAPVGTTEKPLEAGAIWFNTTNHSIEVYTGSTWVAYTGVISAAYDEKTEKLTIVNYDNSKVEIDFSVYATDEALTLLTGRVTTLEGTVATQGGSISDLLGRMTAVEGKAKANEDKLAGLTEATVMAEIAKQVKVETDRATGVEGGLDTRLGTLETKVTEDYEDRIADLEALFGEGDGSVSDQIADAVKAAEDRVDEKLATKADKAVYEKYVSDNDAAVDVIRQGLAEEVLRATGAEALINEKIGVPADVEGVTAYSKDYTVGQDVKAAKDAAAEAAEAAASAQKTIDDFLTGEGVDPNKVDALKEIISYMEEHGEEYQAVVDNLDTLNTDVATLKGTGEGSVAKAVADAKADIKATIEANEKVTANALTELDGRVEVLEALSAGTEISNIKGRLDVLDVEVNTNIPQDIADAQAAAEATAAADATSKANAAEAAAKGHADGLIAAEVTRSNKYADDAVAAEAAIARAAEKANADAIAALDAKVVEGLAWVIFE